MREKNKKRLSLLSLNLILKTIRKLAFTQDSSILILQMPTLNSIEFLLLLVSNF